MKVYQLKKNEILNGAAFPPYLAVKSLQQLVIDEEKNDSLAETEILSDLYMDDFLTESESVDIFVELKNQLIKCLRSGGFIWRTFA